MRRIYTAILRAILFVIFFTNLTFAQSLSNSERTDKKEINQSLVHHFSTIERKFDVAIMYRTHVAVGKKSSIIVENYKTADEALSALLTPLGLTFKKIEHKSYIVVAQNISVPTEPFLEPKLSKIGIEGQKKSDERTHTSVSLLTRTYPAMPPIKELLVNIGGTVKSAETGEALPGVSVQIKGTVQGTQTDENGSFQLSSTESDVTLIFSIVGYLTQEVRLQGKTTVDVSLETDEKTLGEVVVVGYGEQKKSDLTGSVSSVNAKDLNNVSPAGGVMTALQGRVPGLYISQTDGNPNSGASVVLRGPVSINNSTPLYVIDGLPVDQSVANSLNLNVQDIENVTVLKDAAAAAIYGAVGGGGVILITTKKGRSGKMKVSFGANYGLRDVINLPQSLLRDDYLKTKKIFGADMAPFGPESEWTTKYASTDWFAEQYRTGVDQNYNISLTGGNATSTFFISGAYSNIKAVRIGNEIERYSIRLNSEHKIGKRIRFGENIFGVYRNEDPNRTTNQGSLNFRHTPLSAVYDPTNPIGGWGKLAPGYQGGHDLQAMLGNENISTGLDANMIGYVEADIIKGLTFRTAYGITFNSGDWYFNELPADLGSTVVQQSFDINASKGQSQIATQLLTYSNTFGKHYFKAMVGYEARKSSFTFVNSRDRLPPTVRPVRVVTTASSEVNAGRNEGFGRILSQFGRLEYSFDDKYLFNANLRRDQFASKFREPGIFSGFSAAWKISSEPFMKSLRAVNNLKLRVGYGSIGNTPDGNDFIFNAIYTPGFNFNFSGDRQTAVGIGGRLANPDIRWENVTTLNAGVDMGLFNGKINLSVDYYDRQTNDMLYSVPISPSLGLGPNVLINIGQMINKGVEFLVEHQNRIGDFTYSIGVNGGTNSNELISLDPALEKPELRDGSLTEAQNVNGLTRSIPGESLGKFWGYKSLGIYQDDVGRENRPLFQTEDPKGYRAQKGDLIYEDLNGDKIIDKDDQQFIGNPWPNFTYGFNFRMGFKGFDFSAVLAGVAGNEVYNAYQTYEHQFFNDYNVTSKIYETSGFNGQGVTDKPRIGTAATFDPNRNWLTANSYHVESGAFLRLRNLQVGYTLPTALLGKMKMSNLRIFVMGENLFTLTSYTGINPDVSGSFRERGIDNANQRYPISKVMSFGINADF